MLSPACYTKFLEKGSIARAHRQIANIDASNNSPLPQDLEVIYFV